ncbi:MAG: N-acetyl-gamma-glutamyl-phosphate reductase, partial [Thermomicrobiales bacterium]
MAASLAPRAQRGLDPAAGPRRVRVGIIGATGYVGGELVRLLARHPNVDLVGLTGRGRDHDPI